MKPIDGSGKVFLIDSCLEDNAQCYLIPTDQFIKEVADFFQLKEATLQSTLSRMADTTTKSGNSSEKFDRLLDKWKPVTFYYIPYVLKADATIMGYFSDWDEMNYDE